MRRKTRQRLGELTRRRETGDAQFSDQRNGANSKKKRRGRALRGQAAFGNIEAEEIQAAACLTLTNRDPARGRVGVKGGITRRKKYDSDPPTQRPAWENKKVQGLQNREKGGQKNAPRPNNPPGTGEINPKAGSSKFDRTSTASGLMGTIN